MKALIADDDLTSRMILQAQLKPLGRSDLVVNGREAVEAVRVAVAALEPYDLICLDVLMPELSGLAALKAIRDLEGTGRRTPVILMTSESKRETVADALKFGISDFIMKPFDPAEVLAKVRKALGVDILVVDGRDHVQVKLRSMLPACVTIMGAATAPAAITLCRELRFRHVLIDVDPPGDGPGALVRQLRELQPDAVLVALARRSATSAGARAAEHGCAGVLYKPFAADAVDERFRAYVGDQALVHGDADVIRILGYVGGDAGVDCYFRRVGELFEGAVDEVAAACFDDAIADLDRMPRRADRLPPLVAAMKQHARRAGVQLKLVGDPEVAALLIGCPELADLPIFRTVDEARAPTAG